MSKNLEKALKRLERRKAKRVGVARLRAGNGAVLEFDIIPPRDSIIAYSQDGITFVVIRRRGYMIRGHILRVYLCNGTLIYEGDVISFSSFFKFKRYAKPRRKAFAGVEK